MRSGKDFIDIRPDYVFPVRLQTVMKADCLDTFSLSRMLEVSESAIKGYLDGSMIPSIENATMLARKLDVSLNWLCGLEDN